MENKPRRVRVGSRSRRINGAHLGVLIKKQGEIQTGVLRWYPLPSLIRTPPALPRALTNTKDHREKQIEKRKKKKEATAVMLFLDQD